MTDTITIHEQPAFVPSRIQPSGLCYGSIEISRQVEKTIIRLSRYADGSFALTVGGSRVELTADELAKIANAFHTQAENVKHKLSQADSTTASTTQ